MVWGMALLVFLPDSPLTARFLNDNERHEAVERLKANQTGIKNTTIQWHQVWEALRDHRVWILFFFQIANNIPNGGLTTVSSFRSLSAPATFVHESNYSQFGSIVMTGFGYSTLQTYLLQMPMGAFHALFAVGR